MDKVTEAMLPCPFCGDAAVIDDFSTSYRKDAPPLWYVGCNNNACCVESGSTNEDKGLAISRWNTRAQSPDPVTADLIGRLRDDAGLCKERSISCRKIGDKEGQAIASQIADDLDEAAYILARSPALSLKSALTSATIQHSGNAVRLYFPSQPLAEAAHEAIAALSAPREGDGLTTNRRGDDGE